MEPLHVARTPGPDEGEARHHEDPFTSPARPTGAARTSPADTARAPAEPP